MATSDEVPCVRITYSDYKPDHESDLVQWLAKEATRPTRQLASLNEDEDGPSEESVYESPDVAPDESDAAKSGR